jgi:negative modulator of initiation of replication
MKPIDLDPDIHQYLLHNSTYFGEPASSILRRGLNLMPIEEKKPAGATESDLDQFLQSSEMIYAKGVVGKFLVVLGWLHQRHGADFHKVESIKGRGRLYFAKDRATLERSGRSVNPKPIPKSAYWVITTTPTNLKQEILHNVMKALGFPATEIAKATAAIAR